MATQLQLRRGTTSETGSFTGAVGEVSVDTTKDTLVVHDGSTAGGFEMAKADGSNMTAINVGDNVKAQFGSPSNDLQIYHDASDSYISDQGSGNLKLLTDEFRLRNAADTAHMITSSQGGAVALYHNNGAKIATTSTGVDVTGSATMDGLTVDGNIDINGGYLDIGPSSGNIGKVGFDSNNVYIGSSSGAGQIIFKNNISSAGAPHSSGDTKMVITDTGIDVTGTASVDGLSVGGTSPRSGYIADFQGTSGNSVNIQTGDEASDISLSVGSLSTPDKFTVTAGGDVTIANGNLDVTGTLDVTNKSTILVPDGTGDNDWALQVSNLEATDDRSFGIKIQAGSTATDTPLFIQTHDGGETLFNLRGSGDLTVGGNVSIPNGDLLVGTASSIGTSAAKLEILGGTGGGRCINTKTAITTSANAISFNNGNGQVGSIATNGSATAYNTSSDYRLKEDVQAMSGATDRLKELKPVNFAWKVDGLRVDGFLAHEAQEVVPESVTGSKDAMMTEEYEVSAAVYEDVVIPAVEAVEAEYDEEGNVVVEAVEAQEERTEQRLVTEAVMGEREVPDYQGIDQAKLVPLLVATIQELEARITALEA